MDGIVGQVNWVSSNLNSLDAHLLHLKNLENKNIVQDLLGDKHGFVSGEAKKVSKTLSFHISQALTFYYEGKNSAPSIRPLLQYYCYLNLAVAAILAFRPHGYEGYRKHGVSDLTANLEKVKLSSLILKVNRSGAIPLFHSLFSDIRMDNKKMRLGEVFCGFHMIEHELIRFFDMNIQAICVNQKVFQDKGKWFSQFSFKHHQNVSLPSKRRIESTIPLLQELYSSSTENCCYISKQSWNSKEAALKQHRLNGMKIVNYGGSSHKNNHGMVYHWHGQKYKKLMPSLTSILLSSFFLSSVARYRPYLQNKLMSSPISLLVNTFMEEADHVLIPSVRNLIYQEELIVTPFQE